MKKWLTHWRAILIILLMVVTVMLAPDKTEVDQLVLLGGMGITKTENALLLSAELSPREKNPEANVVTVKGNSLEQCLLRIEEALPGKPYWGGTAILLLNESAAQDVGLLLDIYARRDLNPSMKPLLAAGDCEELLTAGFSGMDMASGAALNLSLRKDTMNLMEYLRSMAVGQEPMLPIAFMEKGTVRIYDVECQ